MTVIEDLEYTEKGTSKYYTVKAGGTFRAFSGTIAFVQLKEGKFKKGDNVNLKFTEVDGKAADGTAIKHKNLDLIEQLPGTGNEVSPTPKAEIKTAPVTKNSSSSDGNMTDEEYRAYQIKMMEECLDDANKFATFDLPVDKQIDVAIGFFEKRNSPRVYARKEKK